MILLVLVFIVNRNFKLLNRHGILLLLSFVLLPFSFFLFFHVIIVCVPAVLQLLLLFTYYYYYLLTYLLIYLFIFIILSIFLICGLDLYKVQPFKPSPHIIFTTVCIDTFKICKMKFCKRICCSLFIVLV